VSETVADEAGRKARAAIPPWIDRLLWTIVGIIVGLFVVYNVLRRLRGLIVLLAISLFLSIALEPGVNFLERKGWRRGLATGVIFLAVAVVAGLFLGLMIPLIVDQTLRLVGQLPGYIRQTADFAARLGIEFSPERISEAVTTVTPDLQQFAGDIAGGVFGVGSALLSTVLQLMTIALFTFYMTADGPRLRRVVCSLLPPARQREVLRVIDIAIDKTGAYFYSRALLAAFAAALAWMTFTIIGIPFALALALWTGILSQFVPVVGTYLGGALPLLIGFLEGAGQGIAVLVFIVVYQQLENYLLAPRITARTMALHPAVSFAAVIAGATLLGAPGALMALPIAATIQAFVSTYLQRYSLVESPLTAERAERSAGAGAEGGAGEG
jgi:predicted PurR-regulated permease PerM